MNTQEEQLQNETGETVVEKETVQEEPTQGSVQTEEPKQEVSEEPAPVEQPETAQDADAPVAPVEQPETAQDADAPAAPIASEAPAAPVAPVEQPETPQDADAPVAPTAPAASEASAAPVAPVAPAVPIASEAPAAPTPSSATQGTSGERSSAQTGTREYVSRPRPEYQRSYDRTGGDRSDRSDSYSRDDRNFRKRRNSNPRFRRMDNIDHNFLVIDYKQPDVLKHFLSERGKLLPKRFTRISTKKQRQLSRAVKRARILGLLPYK